MQILRLLFAICKAPIKQLVYPPIFEIFVIIFPVSCEMTVNTQVEIETKGMQFFGGEVGGANKVYFGWFANWQIKLSKYIFSIFTGVTTLKVHMQHGESLNYFKVT